MTLHAAAYDALVRWQAPSPAQEALRVTYAAHLRANPDGVWRSCFPDHLTASTLVLSADGSHALLQLHAKAGRWFQLGGHCEEGDTTLAGAAHREAVEESGLASSLLALDGVPVQLSEHPVPFCRPGGAEAGRPVHHLDVRYLVVAPEAARPEVSEESLDVRWWPVDDLPDPEADLLRLVELARERLTARGLPGA